MLAYPLTLVLSILQASDDLSVDEVSADAVLAAVMPRGEDFFAEIKAPGGMLLLPTFPLYLLLTLGNGIHHMLMPTAQRPPLWRHETKCYYGHKTFPKPKEQSCQKKQTTKNMVFSKSKCF